MDHLTERTARKEKNTMTQSKTRFVSVVAVLVAALLLAPAFLRAADVAAITQQLQSLGGKVTVRLAGQVILTSVMTSCRMLVTTESQPAEVVKFCTTVADWV